MSFTIFDGTATRVYQSKVYTSNATWTIDTLPSGYEDFVPTFLNSAFYIPFTQMQGTLKVCSYSFMTEIPGNKYFSGYIRFMPTYDDERITFYNHMIRSSSVGNPSRATYYTGVTDLSYYLYPLDNIGRLIPNILPNDLQYYVFHNQQESENYLKKIDNPVDQDNYARQYAINYYQVQGKTHGVHFYLANTGNYSPIFRLRWEVLNENMNLDDVKLYSCFYTFNTSYYYPVTGEPMKNDDKPLIQLLEVDAKEQYIEFSIADINRIIQINALADYCCINWWLTAYDSINKQPVTTQFYMVFKRSATSPKTISQLEYGNYSIFDTSVLTWESWSALDPSYIEPEDPESPISPDNPISVVGVMTTSYSMSSAHLRSLADFIWNNSLFDNIKLWNNSPIENIVSCKKFPFSVSGTDTSILIGNVNTSIIGSKLASEVVNVIDMGTITIPKRYNSFLDYEPYTMIDIYLPYIGFHQLNPSMYMGKSLNIKYYVNLIGGECRAILLSNGQIIDIFDGVMGIDIPLTSSNRAQIEASVISSIPSIGINAVSGNTLGVATDTLDSMSKAFAPIHYTSTGSSSGALASFGSNKPFVMVSSVVYQEPTNYNHIYGKPCNITKRLSDVRGFTIVSNIDTSNLSAHEEVKEEIKNLFATGVYL